MEDKIKSLSYEETDKKIKVNLYGIEFEIKGLNNNKVKELKEVDKKIDTLENEIENILGEGSIEKINEKRKNDGYDKLDLDAELTIIWFLASTYIEETTKKLSNNVVDTFNKVTNNVNRANRYTRRNYKRNYRR